MERRPEPTWFAIEVVVNLSKRGLISTSDDCDSFVRYRQCENLGENFNNIIIVIWTKLNKLGHKYLVFFRLTRNRQRCVDQI